MTWILGREEAAGGGEEGREEEEEVLTSNFGEDNRSESSRKWIKEKLKNCTCDVFCFI